MTITRKKTVFISSTYEDLIQYRRKVWELLGDYDVNIRGMERFGARKETPLQTCLAEIEQSDIYIGILAYKLGSIEKTSSKSYTQLEYEKASELKKEIFIYLIDEKDSKISPNDIDFGDKHEKLKSFKSILKESHTIDTFINEEALIEKLKRKFDELLLKKTSESNPIDEYQTAKSTIDKFLLVPKAFSGKDVKLKIRFISEPFPASKAVCSSFSLDYGKTIGVEIMIINPQISVSSFNNLFIEYDKLDSFWGVQKNDEVEIYAQLQFSEESILNFRANFVEKIYTTYETTTTMSPDEYFGFKSEIVKAEGQIILKLSSFIRQQIV